jgi:hypothetical protein
VIPRASPILTQVKAFFGQRRVEPDATVDHELTAAIKRRS